MKLVWKTCPVNHRYEVSNHGFVRNAKTKKILKPYILKGYFRLTLSEGKKNEKKNHLISRLVLLTFEGESPDPKKRFAAHENGNSFDNRLENLSWKSRKENEDDKIEHGTSNRVVLEEDVLLMRNYYANGMTQKELAKRFGCSKSNVSLIVRGHRCKT